MNKVRVYEVARELGVDNREAIQRIASMGIQVKNHMSVLEPAEVDRIKRAFDRERTENMVEERIRPTVVRRKRVRSAGGDGHVDVAVAAAAEGARDAGAPISAEIPRQAPTPVTAEPEDAEPAQLESEPPRSSTTGDDGGYEEAAPSSEPPMSQDRFAHAPLPPGVMRRGNAAAPSIVSRLTEADRQRIVAEHQAQQRTEAPRRREVRGRAAIGPQARPQGRPGKKRLAPGKKAQKTEITTPSAQKRVIRIEDQIQLQTLAQRMSLKATELLMKLMQMGMTGVHINSTLDADTAGLLAAEFNYEVENVARSEEETVRDARGEYEDRAEDRGTRAPIVTVMGHVDHGKTSLLDKIRKADVAAGEAGGITQHIGAYRVDTDRGPIVFLDTPGHEAFTAMRARGAQATDVVILVVAADDGVMPQTREAIAHAKAAGVPIVVAVNKIDKPDARADRIMQELTGEGLQPEEWGGETIFVKTSAVTGEGIDKLLDSVLLQSEMLELEANPKIPAEGVVLEAYLDRGRGPVANVLVRNGTLASGDFLVAGSAWGRVRALTDDRGRKLRDAGPATPVEILGLQDLPAAGDPVYAVTDQKRAQEVADSAKKVGPQAAQPVLTGLERIQEILQSGEIQELRLVVKADVQGSVEALQKALTDLGTEKVKVLVIHAGVGGITENDVMLAKASNAIIIGFNVRPQGKASGLAKTENTEIRTYSIIYEAIDDVKKAMAGLLAPKLVEKELGKAEVRQTFGIPKIGTIAGCMVVDGKIVRSGKARLVRDGVLVWQGDLGSLRRFKDDVREVTNGFECGIGLQGYNDMKEGDVIECFEVEQIQATLE